ncbi:MAG: 3-phosphoshikimate 1-carboxyvinyltransferase [Flavobacteriaceae bacterium]|nr:3-phosphoshikimate 1-carboxyvinyltransferase [Flavobacteriaceae bacterium]
MKAMLSRDHAYADNHPVIEVSGSKSESNRLLILQALYPNVGISNLSDSDDTRLLQQALANSNSREIDVHHAGTAMRFLTSYLAIQDGRTVVLTGSDRMKQRPISILVDALRNLGAKIEYIGETGFPPLKIQGTVLQTTEVKIESGTSSQYISSLLLIAPSLPNGLKIKMKGNVTSRPYIDMTCHLLRGIGCQVDMSENSIQIYPLVKPDPVNVVVESDWSSASYFYSVVSLSENLSVTLRSYKHNSLQGDAAVSNIYKSLGVDTRFDEMNNRIVLAKNEKPVTKKLTLDLARTPDIAQTIAVSCFGHGIACELTGLHTLKIKETDRLAALKNELEKLGGKVEITKDSLLLSPAERMNGGIVINTYDDHRMAMAFAPLALKHSIGIEDPEVVSKSFPSFWEAIARTGIRTEIQR